MVPTPTSPISIACAPGIRTSGETVAGHVLCNVPMDDVTSVSITLRGEITAFDEGAYNTPSTVQLGVALPHEAVFIDSTKILFSCDTASDAASLASRARSTQTQPPTQTALPFTFKLPANPALPPSFAVNNGTAEGRVSYTFVARVTYASRRSRVMQQLQGAQRTAKDVFEFPFLPADKPPSADDTDAPSGVLVGDEWTGEWIPVEASEKLKKGVFGSSGSSTVKFELPKMRTIPMFTPIPVRVTITNTSKALPSTASRTAPSSGALPASSLPSLPTPKEIALRLHQRSVVTAGIQPRIFDEDLGARGFDGSVGTGVREVQRGEKWVLEEGSVAKGRWITSITYGSTVVFDGCTPPFRQRFMSTSLYLALAVQYPSTRTTVKLQSEPIHLTSGFAARGARNAADVPPPFEAHAADAQGTLPPSYFANHPIDVKAPLPSASPNSENDNDSDHPSEHSDTDSSHAPSYSESDSSQSRPGTALSYAAIPLPD